MVVLVPAIAILVLAKTNSLGIVPVGMGGLVHHVSGPDLGDLDLLLMVVLVPAIAILVLAETNSLGIVPVSMGGLNCIRAVLNSLVRAEDQGPHGVVVGFHLMAHHLGRLIRIPTERSPRTKSCNCLPKLTSMAMAR